MEITGSDLHFFKGHFGCFVGNGLQGGVEIGTKKTNKKPVSAAIHPAERMHGTRVVGAERDNTWILTGTFLRSQLT